MGRLRHERAQQPTQGYAVRSWHLASLGLAVGPGFPLHVRIAASLLHTKHRHRACSHTFPQRSHPAWVRCWRQAVQAGGMGEPAGAEPCPPMARDAAQLLGFLSHESLFLVQPTRVSFQEAPIPFPFLDNPVALRVPGNIAGSLVWPHTCHVCTAVSDTPRAAALPPTLRSQGGLDVWTVLAFVT